MIGSKKINVWYGEARALSDITMDILEEMVTALIGPSGCGKSTFLRCVNRMNGLIDSCRVEESLKSAALWEVKDQLDGSGLELSGDNDSGSASPAPSRRTRRSFSWTNPPRP